MANGIMSLLVLLIVTAIWKLNILFIVSTLYVVVCGLTMSVACWKYT